MVVEMIRYGDGFEAGVFLWTSIDYIQSIDRPSVAISCKHHHIICIIQLY